MKQEPLSKNRRKLSRFLCQEMLYDFISHRLDPDRTEAVREFIETDEQVREEFECVQQGIRYAEDLSRTPVTPALIERLKFSELPSKRILNKILWTNWPPAVRLGTEALVISAFVAVVMSTLPWQKISVFRRDKSKQIEITQVEARKKIVSDDVEVAEGEKQPEATPPPADVSKDDLANTSLAAQAALEDEGSDDHEEPVKPPVLTPNPREKTAARLEPAKETKVAAAKEDDQGKPPSANLAPGATPVPVDSQANEDAQTAESLKGKPKGFVYKAFMKLNNLDDMTPQIADIIRNLGGQRAGEVELGWRRDSGSYYHFTLPESNYQELLNSLKTFGPVQIFKESHRRVMPAGKIRFILWVEDGDK